MAALFRSSGTASFDGLYRRHVATVYRYAFAVLGNHADAEDVTQTTFLNAYRALAQGVRPRKAENWLLTIAHNQVRQHFRTVKGKPLEVELDDTLSGPAPERDEPSVGDVLHALQALPPAQRAAIVMREFEGRSYAEIAEIMELTPSALEALIFRARRSLAEQLEEALTCDEAEAAVSRRLDGRLARRETRKLRAHMRACPSCARFEHVQREQRQLLKGLSLIPVPASLLLFRGETAAAAGLGAAGAAAGGGGIAVGAGGLAGSGAAAAAAGGVTAKVAAVAAAAAVTAGGVGYGVSTAGESASKAERKVEHAQAVEATREGARAAQVRAAKARGERPGPALPASAKAHAATTQAAAQRARRVSNSLLQAPGATRSSQAARATTNRARNPGSAPSLPTQARTERAAKQQSVARPNSAAQTREISPRTVPTRGRSASAPRGRTR